MIMADVLKIFLLIVGAQLVLLSYWLAFEALFPHRVARCEEQYRRRPILSTFLGCVLAVPAVVVALVLANAGNAPAKVVGVLLGALPVLLGLFGSAGLGRRIGRGLASPLDDTQPWRRVLRGGVVLVFAFLLPFIGWFVVLPWAILSGAGAFALATLAGRRERREPTEAASP